MTDKKPKIAILHDAFLYRGGGERLISLMAEAIGADLISGFFSEGSFDPRELWYTGKMIALGKPVFAKGLRHEVLRYRFVHQTAFLNEYDIVIFSGNCLEAVSNCRVDAQKIYYCHTPPRYIFDLRADYLKRIPRWLHPLANLILNRKSRKYIDLLARMDTIITNSQNVHDRLLAYCGYESEIIYPPTDTDFFTPWNSAFSVDVPFPAWEYFYSWARLSPPKRVDLIIEAFIQMPDKYLIFSYWANDPMRAELLEKIQWYTNIHAIEAPSDELLLSLIRWAISTIYIPVDEDFGMSPVESMACGTPVIGVDEGWLRETIIEWKTGKLIEIKDSKGWIQNLKSVIQNTKKEEWEAMSVDCISRARDFSLDAFEKKLKSSLQL
jgi:glycosyltransferase involved in cell wall biosynthesis